MTDAPDIEFPAGFLIGAATAAHQIEGGNVNADLWDAEHAPGSIFVEPSGDACDSYHRYGKDITLLADAGLDTYRFGVEWARVEPEEGEFSRAALDHYRRMAHLCHERGIIPMVTLQHFTSPKWFARAGGWRGESAAELFGRYAGRVASHLGDFVSWWCTINEANIKSMGLASAGASVARNEPGERRSDTASARPPIGGYPSSSVEVMGRAHRSAAEAIKSASADAKVGWTLALQDYQAAGGGEERCAAVRKASQLDWLDVSKGDDFIGVQTYSRELIGPDGRLPVPDGARTTQMGYEFYPQALEGTVRLAAGHARVPVLVTENGIATADDAERIEYAAEALRGVRRCLDDGVDVRGYLHWSLLDNYEWMHGYAKTFGLIAVDRETFERRPKPSLAWLGAVARGRGGGSS